MPRLPLRLAVRGSLTLGILGLFVLTAGLAWAARPSSAGSGPTVTFDKTIAPPNTPAFDISFVKNDIGKYVLADSGLNQVDLFDATTQTYTGPIGHNGFVGRIPPTTDACGFDCSGPNGVLIDSSNNVWAADGPAKFCSTPDCACPAGNTTYSMVKEYTLASPGTRLACINTLGEFRSDEMAFDPRDNFLLVANPGGPDSFLTLINTTTASIADRFCYADSTNTTACPTSALARVSTAGGGLEQPVYDPQQGFFYQAVPQGTSTGRVDVFNPKSGKLVYLRSIDVPGCSGGPTGLALDPSTHELLGACGNGAALINANSGKSSIIGSSTTTGGADEIWFDPGSNAWYLAEGGFAPGTVLQLGVVSAASGHAVEDISCPSSAGPGTGCGHSVAAYTASSSQSFVFDPNMNGTGVDVFTAAP